MHTFSTQNLANVFAEEGKYDGFKKLVYNLTRGEDIFEYDESGVEKRVSRSEANKAIRKVFMDVCGLTEDDLKSNKTRRRAEKAHANEIFEIIEEEIDFRVNKGFEESEWFNNFVDQRNIKLGDAQEFYVDTDVLFIVGDYSGDNHDITMQQLPEGKPLTIKTTPKTIKIGKDIDLIVLGRVDFTKWIERVAESYVQYVQKMVYDMVTQAAAKLPSQYKGSGELSSSTKTDFDELIEQVAVANASDVVIMGTKTALKKITALAQVQWASEEQKKAIADTGRLGSYEGTVLVEIPQRLDLTDTTKTVVDNDVLWLMPVVDDKFVKFVDEGETEIFEVTEKAQLVDDFDTYEMSRRMGADIVLGQYFGVWTIEE